MTKLLRKIMGGKSKELFQNERDEITTYNVQF